MYYWLSVIKYLHCKYASKLSVRGEYEVGSALMNLINVMSTLGTGRKPSAVNINKILLMHFINCKVWLVFFFLYYFVFFSNISLIAISFIQKGLTPSPQYGATYNLYDKCIDFHMVSDIEI